jgi:uncharacterized membrane protein
MLRRSFPLPRDPQFRFRGHEISRLETFTDAVFGFALTLLVVSLEVPKTADELLRTMRGFLPFAVCFAALLQIWWMHNRYFRRYGLNDVPVFLLNSALLFVVLFYVYPMKFLFGGLLGGGGGLRMPLDQARDVLTIYSAGVLAVAAVFGLLHAYALRQADRLALSRAERAMTVHSMAHDVALAAFGAASILIARLAAPTWVSCAGWVYFGIPISMCVLGLWFGQLVKRAAAADAPKPVPAQTA